MNPEERAVLVDVRRHLKGMRLFLAVETPEAIGTRRINDEVLAKVSDLLQEGA